MSESAGGDLHDDPLEFLRQDVPALFADGLEILRGRAGSGDARAKARYDDVVEAKGVLGVEVGDEGGVWLAVARGRMEAHDAPPADLPVRAAVGVSPEALRLGMDELRSRMRNRRDDAAVRVASMPSRVADDALGSRTLQFHVVLTELPDLGEATVRVGLGVDTPPAEPPFTATVRYDDLDALWEGDLDPQQLLMGGRVRFAGDYAPALQVAMELQQRLAR